MYLLLSHLFYFHFALGRGKCADRRGLLQNMSFSSCLCVRIQFPVLDPRLFSPVRRQLVWQSRARGGSAGSTGGVWSRAGGRRPPWPGGVRWAWGCLRVTGGSERSCESRRGGLPWLPSNQGCSQACSQPLLFHGAQARTENELLFYRPQRGLWQASLRLPLLFDPPCRADPDAPALATVAGDVLPAHGCPKGFRAPIVGHSWAMAPPPGPVLRVGACIPHAQSLRLAVASRSRRWPLAGCLQRLSLAGLFSFPPQLLWERLLERTSTSRRHNSWSPRRCQLLAPHFRGPRGDIRAAGGCSPGTMAQPIPHSSGAKRLFDIMWCLGFAVGPQGPYIAAFVHLGKGAGAESRKTNKNF